LSLRSASFAAPQNWPLCFAASGNLAMMAANIAPLFQHGKSLVLSGRSGRTACVPGRKPYLWQNGAPFASFSFTGKRRVDSAVSGGARKFNCKNT